MRVFLDLGAEVASLLEDAHLTSPLAARLPHAFESEAEIPRVQPLADPLTSRELEVLGLVVVGLSNAEIAERLFIAHGTAKRHVNNIYLKLGVHHRAEAAAKARQLGLVD